MNWEVIDRDEADRMYYGLQSRLRPVLDANRAEPMAVGPISNARPPREGRIISSKYSIAVIAMRVMNHALNNWGNLSGKARQLLVETAEKLGNEALNL